MKPHPVKQLNHRREMPRFTRQHERCCKVAACTTCNSWRPALPLLRSALASPTSQNRERFSSTERKPALTQYVTLPSTNDQQQPHHFGGFVACSHLPENTGWSVLLVVATISIPSSQTASPANEPSQRAIAPFTCTSQRTLLLVPSGMAERPRQRGTVTAPTAVQ